MFLVADSAFRCQNKDRTVSADPFDVSFSIITNADQKVAGLPASHDILAKYGQTEEIRSTILT